MMPNNRIPILAKVTVGSHLFGLENEESDVDFKEIYLTHPKDLILKTDGNINDSLEKDKSENANNNDFESFSLHTFLKHCRTAQDVAIVALHASEDKILIDSDEYRWLRAHRKDFYTKNMIGSLGYAKSQSVKYALRAERMNKVKEAMVILESCEKRGIERMGQIWDELPDDGQFLIKTIQEDSREVDKRIWTVVGKGITVNTSPEYALTFITKLYNKYGDRVKVAANLEDKDYKSISHAFRTAYQLYHIYKHGGFEFPLEETGFLRDVKFGRLNFLKDNLDYKLNELIVEVEKLAKESDYPEAADTFQLNSLIMNSYIKYFNLNFELKPFM